MCTHSIMFHHFHDNKHPPSQGSISGKDFCKMIDWLSRKYNLIGAKEYLKKLNSNEIDSKDVCLSFDDALLSQYDIAFPILKKRGLHRI